VPTPKGELKDFTRLWNPLFEALRRADLSGRQRRVLDAIIEASYGWRRTETGPLSYSDLEEATGIPRRKVGEHVSSLIALGVIERVQEPGPAQRKSSYRVVKDFRCWSPQVLDISLMSATAMRLVAEECGESVPTSSPRRRHSADYGDCAAEGDSAAHGDSSCPQNRGQYCAAHGDSSTPETPATVRPPGSLKTGKDMCKDKGEPPLNSPQGGESSPQGRRRVRQVWEPGTPEYDLAALLRQLILERKPNARVPPATAQGLAPWAKHIDLLLRVDRRTPEEVERLIRWSQQDPFWSQNILSTQKLRKQLDQLELKMARSGPRGRRGRGLTPRELAEMALQARAAEDTEEEVAL